ncbi:MAG: hypothetical protein IH600_15040 [Bacteroidetes bacterium]|nr:hypothetical protein [Bacteroidota bacterium]
MYQIIINGLTLLVKAKSVEVTQRSESATMVTIDDNEKGLSFMVGPNATIKVVPPASPSRIPPDESANSDADAHDLAHDYHKRVA